MNAKHLINNEKTRVTEKKGGKEKKRVRRAKVIEKTKSRLLNRRRGITEQISDFRPSSSRNFPIEREWERERVILQEDKS